MAFAINKKTGEYGVLKAKTYFCFFIFNLKYNQVKNI